MTELRDRRVGARRGRVRRRSITPAATLGALMLGVATMLVPKVRADDHWSTSPKVTVVSDDTDGGSDDTPQGLAPDSSVLP